MFVRSLLAVLIWASAVATAAHAEPPAGAQEIPAENMLLIETSKGNVLVALNEEFAPNHVERMKQLARDRFFDGLLYHRVIDDFMAQGGSAELSGRSEPNISQLEAEFTNRVDVGFTPASIGEIRNGRLTVGDKQFTQVNGRSVRDAYPSGGGDLSVRGGYVIFHEPAGRATLSADGKVVANIQHCRGVASMARLGAPDYATDQQKRAAENSATTQYFLMRETAPWLDRQYSAWGRVVAGQDVVKAIAVTENGAGGIPDRMRSVRVVADLPEAAQPKAYWLPVDADAVKQEALALAQATQGSDFDACALFPDVYVEGFNSGASEVDALFERLQ